MTSLTELGLRFTRVTMLAMIMIVVTGAWTYSGFPKREDPAITVRTAIVQAFNPGLAMAQLEELIARPLEEAARAVPGVDEVRTRLSAGQAILQVDIAKDVPEATIARVFDEIRDDLAALARDMPDGTHGPNVDTAFGDVSIASVAVTGEGFGHAQLEGFAEELRNRIYALDEVQAVTLSGVQEERIWLEVDRDRLASIGTTLNPVIAALQGQNVRLSAGSVVTEGTRIPLETSGDFASLDEIGETLVEVPEVGLLRLSDLVTVRRGTVEPADRPVFFNGDPAVIVAVEMYPGEDVVALGGMLQDVVARFEADMPLGVQTRFSTFQPEKVDVSVNTALVNMGQTFVVVLGMMFLFLGLRQALVIASIVPFAVSFAFVGMSFLGIELQQVSIAAIIISLGLLVDNGLVIVEDMDGRIRAGSGRRDAAVAAGRQYSGPLMIASITTVAAFLPLFLLDGTEGQYGFSLGSVVALMLTGSYLSALYILPMLAVWLLPDPVADTKRDKFFDRLSDGYARIAALCVRAPLVVLAACIGLVVFGGSQMGGVKAQLFPLSERNQFLIYMDLPRGTDIARTASEGRRLSDWLADTAINPEITDATFFAGSGGPRFVLTLDPADTDPASGFFIVNTTTYEASVAALERTRAHLSADFPDARFRLKRLAMGGREPGVDVQISGPDADVLLAAAYAVEQGFASAPGLVQNRNDWGARRLTGRIDVAQDRARQYGLTSQTVSEALDGFFEGREVSSFRQGDRLIPIVLRGEERYRDSFTDLSNVAIEASGGTVSLDQFATLEPDLEFSTLRRIDQRRTVTISAISSVLTAQALYDHIHPTLDALDLGPAFDVEIAGELEQAGEVRAKLGAGAPIAAVIMLLGLMTQFNSFRRVGLTLLCVPLVVVGVPLALIGTGQPLSFFGILGLIALSGIIINNAIVLIDQIDIERADAPLNDAIVEAARKRFRPILLASLTTVIGLAPMAISGGALWEPMATLMMGGLGLASILALFYVPALYRLLFRREGAPRPHAIA